ncbi:MAG: Trk system potassium transporter TrkA [Thermodesulfobacteriota bacterium]
MKIIIVGGGEVGFHIAQRLSAENQDVLLVDKDPEKANRINKELDVQALIGSGTSPGMLKSSGIIDADMLVAATDSDEANLIACMLARHLNPYILKVARLRNPEYLEMKDLLSRDILGIDHVINPESAVVENIQRLMKVPGASDVIDFVDGRVKLVGVNIRADCPLAARKLSSFHGMEGKLLIGAIVRGSRVLIPHGEDTIKPDDLVYVVARRDELLNVLGLFGIKEQELKRIIIVGGGQTGSALANALDGTRISTSLIDRSPSRCEELAGSLQRVMVINGDGTDRELLLEENVSSADFLVTLTGDEESNVLISLLGKGLGVRKTITRINKLSYIPLVSSIGLDTIVSSRLSAIRAILQHIRRGKIVSVAPLKGEHAEAIEAEALTTSEIVNTPLSRIKFPKGALIGAVVRGDEIIIPRGDTRIQAGDRLIIFALHEAIPKLEKLLTVKLDYF